MKPLNKVTLAGIVVLAVTTFSCTKLDQKLNSTLNNGQATTALGANGTQLLLQKAYVDLGSNIFSNLGNLFSLQEVTTDECLVPTRAGDWDDNGKWRALHQHTFTADAVDNVNSQYTNLNQLNFDATNVLAFKPTKPQAAEARFLRAIALYHLLDLFGQVPFRNPGDNLLNAPKVLTGEAAVQFIISEITAALPDLSATNSVTVASQDAAKTLLMKVYINHGAFINRAAPTFSDADMQQVITLGNQLINSGVYTYTANYFDNFSPMNSTSKESIFAYPNQSGVAVNNSGVGNAWYSTLHYNSFDAFAPAAGWNGFSTVADFYNSFGVNKAATQTSADTALDPRIGGRYYSGLTNVTGMRTGLLIGQQYDEKGKPEHDRKGNLLAFDPNISPSLKETGSNLEITGIRVLKYLPDVSGSGHKNYNGNAGNWQVIFRYPDVVLMVAEAKLRAASPDPVGALALVNQLRAARGATAMATLPLVNPANVSDPNTLLAERGRELYWESVRRTDLIRFAMFMKPWAYKPASDATHLLFPLPTSAIASNPNFKQNPGY